MKLQLLGLYLLFLFLIVMVKIPIASADLSDGLIAYYPFDGNAEDMSGNENDGTEFGGLSYKLGIQGDSASFDGVDDYIRVPSHSSLNPDNQLSISFWVKIEGFTNAWSPIVHKGGPVLSGCSNREYTVWLQNTSSFLLSSAGDNSSQYYNYACCAKLDNWTHYVGIIDRQNSRMQVYVDGVLIVDGNDPYSTFNNNSNDLIVGWTEEINSAFSPFKGRIDDLRIYDRVLTEEEIKILSKDAAPVIIGCNNTRFCTLEELFNGCSIQVGDLLMTNWELVNADSVNVSNIEIGPGYYSPGDFGVWSRNRELRVVGVDSLSLSYDFRIKNLGADILSIAGNLGYRRVVGPTALIQGIITVGTTQGANDLGSTTDVFSLSQDTSARLIDIPEQINNVWVRTTISLSSNYYDNSGESGFLSSCGGEGPAFLISFNQEQSELQTKADLIGETLKILPNYDFYLKQQSQSNFSIQLTNTSDDSQSATLEIINPYTDLTVSLTNSNPITLAAGNVEDVPVIINSGAMPVGVYDDLLLKLVVENGETLYSNIKITIMEQGTEDLADLTILASDIQLTDYTLGESVTLNTVIHNKGQSTATNVQVRFYELGNLLGEIMLDELAAEEFGTASITAPITMPGEHLIRVVVDPLNAVEEMNENNNEASHIIKLGSPAPVPGSILVTGSLPSTVYTNELFTVSGQAVYDVYVDGVRYTNYVVKGGSVQLTIKDDAGNEWVYGGVHTNIDGYFAKTVQAPATTGTYQITMTVTDKTFSGKRDLLFSVTERPPLPPLPPPSYGQGSWIFVPGGTSSPDTWTWVWTNPPVNAPLSETDLRVFSENIHFSKFNPELGDEITILAEIKYWATSTYLVALDVPVNFYVTYPGTPKMKIGETVIDSLSVGEPDFGSRYVYTSWKNRNEGVHIVEVEIDPVYVEENNLNNAATRAIIVGELESYKGAIAGQVTDPWGGVANIIIELYDSNGMTLLENQLTNDTGYYLFENIPLDDYQVHIVKPTDHRADAETKPAEVTDQSITEIDFHLIRQELPIADPNGPYLGPLDICFDGTGSHDPDGDPLIYYWDFGDGNTGSDVTSCNLYGEAGIYNVCLTVNDGTVDSQKVCTSAVIYDPSAGFVTGGGWIDSPEGAYKPDASLTGKANFGFVSKYKKGATAPTGQTEFQFQTAGLNFHNDSYEWLVVTQGGTNAQFKGEGTINGGYDENGNAYKFMLWAGDGSPDTFRIKIWSEDDEGNETAVYDNGFDQEISGGQVVIHVKN